MGIIDLVEDYWMRESGRVKTAHYPSEAESCRRALYWKWLAESPSEPLTGTSFWRIHIGNAIHEKIQSILHKIDAPWEGWSVETEVSFTYRHPLLSRPISGRIDVVFTDADGKRAGIEIKTTYGAGVRGMKREGIKKYLSQVVLYLRSGCVERFHLPIISRDDGDRVEYILEPSGDELRVTKVFRGEEYGESELFSIDELESIIIQRFIDVERALEMRQLPPRDFRVYIKRGEIRRELQRDGVVYKSDWQCLYCPFLSKCWADEVERYKDGFNF